MSIEGKEIEDYLLLMTLGKNWVSPEQFIADATPEQTDEVEKEVTTAVSNLKKEPSQIIGEVDAEIAEKSQLLKDLKSQEKEAIAKFQWPPTKAIKDIKNRLEKKKFNDSENAQLAERLIQLLNDFVTKNIEALFKNIHLLQEAKLDNILYRDYSENDERKVLNAGLDQPFAELVEARRIIKDLEKEVNQLKARKALFFNIPVASHETTKESFKTKFLNLLSFPFVQVGVFVKWLWSKIFPA